MRQPSLSQLNSQVDEFNEKYKVGDMLMLKLDTGETKQVKLQTPAKVMHGHSAIAWFEEVSGCYLINRVKGRAEV